jgi:hypothetical protein
MPTTHPIVIPAKAGIQPRIATTPTWMAAFAAMTDGE